MAVDYYQWNLNLIKYDQNWNNKSIQKYPYYETQFIISINNSNSYELFVTVSSGVLKLNSNLSLLAYYHGNHHYKGIYYNNTGDYIVVCSSTTWTQYIEILTRDELTFVKHITTNPFTPTDIREFNGTLYVGTKEGVILALKNEIFTSYFNTTCTKSILSLEIDFYGQITILCDSKVYLYSINGNFLNISWPTPISNPTSIGFDGFGNFILTAESGIYVFN